jgi:hypothetical protein
LKLKIKLRRRRTSSYLRRRRTSSYLRRRRTSRSQEQVQEVKDKLAAEPGGEGKPEASHHQ